MLKNDLFIVASGNILKSILKILFIAIISRLILPAEFGQFSLLIVIVSLLNIFNQLSIGPAIIQKKKLSQSELSNIVSFSILVSIIVSIIYLIVIPYYLLFLGQNLLLFQANVMVLFFPISSISVLLEAEYKRNLKFNYVIRNNLLSLIFGYGIITIVFGYYGFGLWALIFGFLAQPLILLLTYSNRFISVFNIKLKLNNVKKIIVFGVQNTLSNLFNFLGEEGDKFLFGKYFSVDLLGAYSRAFQLSSYPNQFLGLTYDTVFFPYFSRYQENKQYIKQKYLNTLRFSFSILLPISFILMINSNLIIKLFLGTQWSYSIPLFSILIVGLSFRFAVKINKSIIKAINEVSKLMIIQFFYAFIIISGIIIFRNLGYLFIPYIILFALIINFIMVSSLIINRLKIKIITFLSYLLPGFIIVSVMILLQLSLKNLFQTNIFYLSLIHIMILLFLITTKQQFFLGFTIKDAIRRLLK